MMAMPAMRLQLTESYGSELPSWLFLISSSRSLGLGNKQHLIAQTRSVGRLWVRRYSRSQLECSQQKDNVFWFAKIQRITPKEAQFYCTNQTVKRNASHPERQTQNVAASRVCFDYYVQMFQKN